MTPLDQRVLFTALAFVAVYIKEPDEPNKADPARTLARYIEDYCRRHTKKAPASSLPGEASAIDIDLALERHIKELRDNEETRLPENRQTLVTFYNRLQQRKLWRVQQEFYATATEDKLTDVVLQHLDEEIQAREALQ